MRKKETAKNDSKGNIKLNSGPLETNKKYVEHNLSYRGSDALKNTNYCQCTLPL